MPTHVGRRAFGLVGGFGASLVLSTAAGVITIPVIIRAGGESVWSAVALGLTVGSLAGVVAALGWPQIGPARVAGAKPEQIANTYEESLVLRGFALGLALPAATIAVLAVVSAHTATALLVAIGTVASRLGASWVFVGVGDPKSLLLWDTFPRVVGSLAGALSLTVSGSALAYGAVYAFGNLAAVGLSTRSVRRRYGRGRRPALAQVLPLLRAQLAGLGIGIVSGVYLAGPLIVLAAVHPTQVAAFALADRVKQYAMLAFSPIVQALQGWVPRASGVQRAERARRAWTAGALLGCLAAAAYVLIGSPLASLLGGGTVTPGTDIMVPLGLALGLNVYTQILGSAVLIPFGRVGAVLRSATAGAVCVVTALVLLVSEHAAPGTAWAVAAAQAAVATYQSVSAIRLSLRTPKDGPAVSTIPDDERRLLP